MITVTGHLGFIGSHLDLGQFEGVDVRGGKDICDMVSVGDAVVHLAAVSSIPASFQNPEETMRTNMVGLARVIRLCQRSGSKLVFVSSSSVVDPRSPYALSKKWGEEMVAQSGLDHVILRLGNVYGERDDKSAIRRFMSDDTITIYGNGQQVRNFVYVGDVVKAIRLALDWWRGTYAIGTENHTIYEVAKMFGKPIKFDARRRGDAPDCSQESHRARANAWQPKVHLEDWIRHAK